MFFLVSSRFQKQQPAEQIQTSGISLSISVRLFVPEAGEAGLLSNLLLNVWPPVLKMPLRTDERKVRNEMKP